MSKNFKATLAVLLILGIIGAIWGPGAVQSRKMAEAKEWIASNEDLVDKAAGKDDLEFSISTALYIRDSGEVSSKERIQELKDKFKELDAPLPFTFQLSVKPNAKIPENIDSIMISIHGKSLSINDSFAIREFIKVLKENKAGHNHKCMGNGQIVLQKGNVKTALELVPSHGDKHIEFRLNRSLYTIEKKSFFTIEELKIFKETISQSIGK